MPISATVKPNLYKDSVALMRVGELALARTGVKRATLLMGTPANKDLLLQAGLLCAGLDAARPGDLMIVVEADMDDALKAAQAEIASLLEDARTSRSTGGTAEAPPRSLAAGVASGADAVLAQISVPAPYAAAEAMKALKLGMHVFLFSDNVPLDQERTLKDFAHRRGLLVMGPDCGTAIIRGVPLGFANVVRKGAIGVVGASGTGMQELTCRIHALGQGVSHAIGTGGRDTYEEIGGITMRQGIDLLTGDPDTRVIALVSKSPARAVAKQVLECAERTGKPIVVLFLGGDLSTSSLPASIVPADTLDDAATIAVALAEGRRFDSARPAAPPPPEVAAEARRFAPGQRHIRGLYSGGTFCTEAQIVWRALGLTAESNVPLDPANLLAEISVCKAHAAIDFGADEFTVGRPHPMIDMSTRIERLAQEARDPSVAVVILDIVLGYGSHDDPAGVLAPVIAQAKAVAARDNRHLCVVSFVCGTEEDPQRLSLQQRKLRDAGAIVATSSTAAARLAGTIAMAAAQPREVAPTQQ